MSGKEVGLVLSPLGVEGPRVGLITLVCSLSQKSLFLAGWQGNHGSLSATSLGLGPGDESLRAAGQEGGVPLSLETNNRENQRQYSRCGGKEALPLASPNDSTSLGLSFLACERLD